MKKIGLILAMLLLGTMLPTETFAQQAQVVQFAKGARDKTLTVTMTKGASKTYSLAVNSGQAIIVSVQSANTSGAEFTLLNPEIAEDHQTDTGEIRILAGQKGKYLIKVTNVAGKNQTFRLSFFVDSAKFY